MRIYLAGPLFSQAEKEFNLRLANFVIDQLAAAGIGARIMLPQEFVTKEMVASWGEDAMRRIAASCLEQLDQADLVVAILDGAMVDDGTAFELGWALAKRPERRIIGLRTDFRRGGETHGSLVNAMIEGTIERICASPEDLIATIMEGRT